MIRRRADCHPDRPAVAGTVCKGCYQTAWVRAKRRREWERLRRPCQLCGTSFIPPRKAARYCCVDCQRMAGEFRRMATRFPALPIEDRYATRDRGHAERLVRTARGRGCRRIQHNQPRSPIEGPYYAAWHRGRGLYVVIIRWPEQAEEELECATG